MISKKLSRVIAIALGIMVGLPIWGLSHFVLWGILGGITTFLMIDIILVKQFPVKIKGLLLALYILTMVSVCILLLTT